MADFRYYCKEVQRYKQSGASTDDIENNVKTT